MKPRVTVAVILGAVVILALIITGTAYVFDAGPFAPKLKAEPLDLGPVIARVDGQPVYIGEARARIAGLATVHGTVEDTLGEDWQDVVMASLVDDRLIRDAAEEEGITVTDQEMDDAVGRIQRMVGGDESDLIAWLDERDMALAELERRLELQTLAARVYITVTKDVEVTGREIRDYYKDHRADYERTDGTIAPVLEVWTSIEEGLLKEQQDLAYVDWLDEQRQGVDLEVLDEDWWKEFA